MDSSVFPMKARCTCNFLSLERTDTNTNVRFASYVTFGTAGAVTPRVTGTNTWALGASCWAMKTG